jgi:transaldolase
VDGPISAEVTALDYEGMLSQARPLAKIHKNVTIKVPLTPDGLRACRAIRAEGDDRQRDAVLLALPGAARREVRRDVHLALRRAARRRLVGGMELIRQIRAIYDNYGFTTQILAASIRHPMHVVDAALAGADVGTMPYKVMLQLYEHPLTEIASRSSSPTGTS